MNRWRIAVPAVVGLLLVSSVTTYGDFGFLGDVTSFEQHGNQVILDCGGPKVKMWVLASDLVRVRLAPYGGFSEDHSYAVIKTEWPAVDFSVEETEEEIEVATSELLIRIMRNPCRISFYDLEQNLINSDYSTTGMGWGGDKVACLKEMPPEERYYGLGEKTGGLNKRGRSWVMWNTDFPGYSSRTDPLYQSHPFFLGLNEGRGYGIFFDNTYRSEFRFAAGTDDFYSFGADGGELDYYFFYGPGLKKVIGRYTELVGRTPLPPKWALGYQQCRYSYYPEAEVRRLAHTFREKEIPCDVIYLDIHYMDGYRCFTWDVNRFPDPKKMLDDLEALGFKVVVIIDPGIKVDPGYWVHDEGLAGNHFCRLPDGSLHVSQVWPGNCYFPDFTKPETREWWGGLYKGLIEQGIDGFWNDMNEPGVWGGTFPDVVQHFHFGQTVDHRQIHNVYGMEMVRGTYEGNIELRPDKRPFVLTRAGFSGVQRYAAVWTGDNLANWEHLRLAASMCLGLGLSGVPFVGFDIGGFGDSPSPELFTRFLQLGVFTPLCRNHTAYGTEDQEPWAFGDWYETINKKVIQMRYELLPYIYDAFHDAAATGLSIMQPLVLEYQADENTHYIDDQFLFGEDLLVAPVLAEGATMRKVYLPKGDWFDFWTNERQSGPAWIHVDAPLDVIPAFAKAGAIVPQQEVVNYVGEKPTDPLILGVFPAPGVTTDSLYEDAGDGFQYRDGRYCLTPYTFELTGNKTVFTIGKRQGQYRPHQRSYLLKFNGIDRKPKSVKVAGQALDEVSSEDSLVAKSRGWRYDVGQHSVWVKSPDTGEETTVIIE